MPMRIHKSYKDVAAICDSELIGKKAVNAALKVGISKVFYSKH